MFWQINVSEAFSNLERNKTYEAQSLQSYIKMLTLNFKSIEAFKWLGYKLKMYHKNVINFQSAKPEISL